MDKRVIQVPMESELVEALDKHCQVTKQARAEVIRALCREFLRRKEIERLEAIHADGYKRIPEDSTIADAQLAAIPYLDLGPAEEWKELWPKEAS